VVEFDSEINRKLLFSEYHSYKDETNLSLSERRIQRTQFSGLGFLGSCFSFFHASTAARLIKKAHDSEDRSCGDDHPFSPYGRPPEYG
jgi:hypothetical protein